ncbi:MAG: M56 family metallopeptidase, partial [Candidatus Acidiferrales bacterium]
AGASALTKGATTNRRGDMKAMSASAKSSQSASARRERQEAVTMAVAKPNAEQETSRQLRQTALQPFFHQGKRDPSKLRASVSHKNSQTAAGRGGGEPGDISRRATGVTREAILPMTQTSRAQKGFSIPWMAVGLGIYFAVTMLFLARLLLGMFLSWRLERASEEIHEREAIRLVRMRACMGGLENTPRLAETKMLSVPATMGVLHPVILLPTDWRKWDEAKLDAIVAHEVSHVARRDALTQRLSLIHRAIFWFSPLAWWMDRQITELAEEASDEAALAGGADQARYAETLLGFFAELEAAPGRIHWEGISMANGCRAERRVERILSWKGTHSMKKWLAVMIVAIAAPLIFVAGSAHPLLAQQDKAPKKAQNTIKPGGPVAPALPAAPSVGVVAPAPVTPAPTTPGIVSPALAAAPEPGPGVGEFTPGPAPQALSATPVGASAPMIAPVPGAPEHPPIVPGPIANGPVAPADLALAGPVVRVASPTPNVGVGVYYGNGIRTGVGVGRIASAAPVAVVAGTQSETPRARYEYGYGYSNDGPRYVMMAGDSESVTMSGSEEDIEHAQRLRKKMGGGDLIWFERDEKSYVITDPAFIAKAKALFAPEEALGKQQEVLGSQQEALGKQQEALGDQMEDVKAKIRDITPELEQVRARLKELQSTGATQRELGRLQSELGQLQREVGRSQSQAGAGQGDIGRQQGELGRKQGELGRRQGELGRQQGELARKASRELRGMFDDAVAKGIAKPE